jgi:hypothetical protein
MGVHVDPEAHCPADILAELLEIDIPLRNDVFRRPPRTFGWRQLWTLLNDLRFARTWT